MQHNLKSGVRRMTVLVPALAAALLALSGPVLSAAHSGDTAPASVAGGSLPHGNGGTAEFNTKA